MLPYVDPMLASVASILPLCCPFVRMLAFEMLTPIAATEKAEVGRGCFYSCLYSMVESNISTCVWLCLGSREDRLFDHSVERQCHSSVVAELTWLQDGPLSR